jgi:hypothetical protein
MNRKKTLVMLGDFGISKELSTISLASSMVGTPNYIAFVFLYHTHSLSLFHYSLFPNTMQKILTCVK